MGAVAFWIALAAVLIASGWLKARGAAMRQEIVMKLVDKGVALDEAPLRLLFDEKPTHNWAPPSPPPGRQVARIAGTLVLFAAAGLAVFFAIAGKYGGIPARDATTGLGVAAGFATFAVGLFVAALFADPRPNGKVIGPTQ